MPSITDIPEPFATIGLVLTGVSWTLGVLAGGVKVYRQSLEGM